MAIEKDIKLTQGHTHIEELRMEVPPIVRKAITSISYATGAVRITTTEASGILNGWRAAVTGSKVKGLDAEDPQKIKSTEYYEATVISPTEIEFNAFDAAGLKAHTAGLGFLQFYTPATLTGKTISVQLKTKKGGTILASNAAIDGALNVIVVDTDALTSSRTITFPVAATELLAGKTGWYDIDEISDDVVPVVTQLAYGLFSVEKQ